LEIKEQYFEIFVIEKKNYLSLQRETEETKEMFKELSLLSGKRQ
jgi:hypothetical protein